jgi:plasmid stabilization system protein ParE
MVKIVWSDNALEDIEQIAEFISKDSTDRATLLKYEFQSTLYVYPLYIKLKIIYAM